MSAILVTMPKLSDTMEEGGIYEWLFQEGEYVDEGEPLLEIETDKATMEYSSPDSGYLRQILKSKGSQVPLMAAIAVLTETQDEPFDLKSILADQAAPVDLADSSDNPDNPGVSQPPDQASPPLSTPQSGDVAASRIKASPLAKKLAAAQGVELKDMTGTGPHGRIVKADVDHYLSQAQSVVTPSASSPGLPSHQGSAGDRRIELTRMRKSIAHSLSISKQQVPHYYLRSTWNLDALVNYRDQWNQHLSEVHRGEVKKFGDGAQPLDKISLNDCFVYCVARALRTHPVVRSFWQGDHILEKAEIHIAVAVAIADGLVTPTIHHADQLGLVAISRRTREVIALSHGDGKARSQLDLTSGVFTISNLGSSRVDEFSAVINPPQSAILAIGRMKQALSLRQQQVVETREVTATMSCDHRVIDGKVGSEFLNTLAHYVENPALMML